MRQALVRLKKPHRLRRLYAKGYDYPREIRGRLKKLSEQAIELENAVYLNVPNQERQWLTIPWDQVHGWWVLRPQAIAPVHPEPKPNNAQERAWIRLGARLEPKIPRTRGARTRRGARGTSTPDRVLRRS